MIEQITNGKTPCIWMEAGVVDFKICHHCYDCPSCEFDRAMTAAAAQNLSLKAMCEATEGRSGGVLPLKARLRHRSFEQLLQDQKECYAASDRPQVEDVFGFAVPDSLFLHRGHTWAALETCGRVRIGLDDFSQKILGPAEEINLPEPGQKMQRDRVGLEISRQGKKAPVLAPLDGAIEVVNPKIRQRPGVVHDDPYGEGWLLVVTPTNLKADLEKMLFGRRNVAWIENEFHKLLGLLESAADTTLPSGGAVIDDVYGHYPQLGWERLVREFLHTT